MFMLNFLIGIWLCLTNGFQQLRKILPLALGLTTAGCASFHPGLVENAAFRQNMLKHEDDRFLVEVVVPPPDEATKLFDCNLNRQGIQPVWVRVKNRTAAPVYFIPYFMDNDYFASLEVAYQFHPAFSAGADAAMDAFFMTNAMPPLIPPGQSRSGFVYTHLDLGNKPVCVTLADDAGNWCKYRTTFVVEVPGLETGHLQRGWEEATNTLPPTECDDERLRFELAKLPRATTDKSGKSEGDPLNLVLIGTPEDLALMASCGWCQTERITSKTAWHTLMSFLFSSQYRYSPVSLLYYAGRSQDIALQKSRGSVKLRNHLRLWQTTLSYHGKPVWIGQISRDIGVRWTMHTPNLTTHKINPFVDEARNYLIQDVAMGRACLWWGFVKGAEAAPISSPRHNLTGDPYFTDGLRIVLELSSEPVEPGKSEFKHWEIPPVFKSGLLP